MTTRAGNWVGGLWSLDRLDPGATAVLTVTGRIATTDPISTPAGVVAADQYDIDSTPRSETGEDDDTTAVVEAVAASLSGSVYADHDGHGRPGAGSGESPASPFT